MDKPQYTTEDFEELFWHDNCLYGISLKVDSENFTSDVVFDIDFITEWICGTDKICRNIFGKNE